MRELTVPQERLEEALLEAEKLPSIEITELDLQWIQVCQGREVGGSSCLQLMARGGILQAFITVKNTRIEYLIQQ